MTEKKIKQPLDDTYRKDAVKLVTDEGYSVAKASKALGISQGALRNWIKKFAGTQDTVNEKDLVEENQRLKRQLREAELERDILKKATAFFAKEST